MSSPKLLKILNNRTLGSSELTLRLNKYFLSIRENADKIKKSITRVRKKLGHFEDMNSYLDDLNSILKKKDYVELTRFLKSYSRIERKRIHFIFKKIFPELKKMESVITLSRSGTVISILKLLHKQNKNLKVIICESRPNYEGRLTARELAKAGVKVDLITDAMMGICILGADAAIVGADIILKNGNLVNKSGSKSLALLCKEHKKPFFVVSTKSKFSTSKKFNPVKENPKEVWNKTAKNLDISNIYFEEVEKKLITKIFTD